MLRERTIPVFLAFLLTVGVFSTLIIGITYFRRPKKISITVLVEDSKTGRPLVDLPVEVDGTLAQTGGDGRVIFTDLYPGSHTFKISLAGFKDFFQTRTLVGGKGGEISFPLNLVTSRLLGRVLDSSFKTPVEGATVVVGGVSATTNSTGQFSLDEVIIGTPTLRIRKEGFKDFSREVPLEKGIGKNLGDLLLKPLSP